MNPASVLQSLELTFYLLRASLLPLWFSAFMGKLCPTSYTLICWCVVILFSMRLQSVVLFSTFVCGFCVWLFMWERERERHHHKPMTSVAETNGLATKTQTQTHSLITEHIQLNIKYQHNSQTQKPIYP